MEYKIKSEDIKERDEWRNYLICELEKFDLKVLTYNFVSTDNTDNVHILRAEGVLTEEQVKAIVRALPDEGSEAFYHNAMVDTHLFFIYCAG